MSWYMYHCYGNTKVKDNGGGKGQALGNYYYYKCPT